MTWKTNSQMDANSAAQPIMSIYRQPLGQYGYTGHVINLPRYVVSFANSLPRMPSELDVQKDSEQLIFVYVDLLCKKL